MPLFQHEYKRIKESANHIPALADALATHLETVAKDAAAEIRRSARDVCAWVKSAPHLPKKQSLKQYKEDDQFYKTVPLGKRYGYKLIQWQSAGTKLPLMKNYFGLPREPLEFWNIILPNLPNLDAKDSTRPTPLTLHLPPLLKASLNQLKRQPK